MNIVVYNSTPSALLSRFFYPQSAALPAHILFPRAFHAKKDPPDGKFHPNLTGTFSIIYLPDGYMSRLA